MSTGERLLISWLMIAVAVAIVAVPVVIVRVKRKRAHRRELYARAARALDSLERTDVKPAAAEVTTCPPEIMRELASFRRRGFKQYIVGDVRLPYCIVMSRVDGGHIDVLHVRGYDRAYVARIPNDEYADIWAPLEVVDHFYGELPEALEYLGKLAQSTRDSEREPYEPPEDERGLIPLAVTDRERAEMKIRYPLANLR